jgi:hypothetical protein
MSKPYIAHRSSCARPASIAVALLSILLPLTAMAQGNPWRAVPESTIASGRERQITPSFYRTMAVDRAALEDVLAQAPMEFTAAAEAAVVELSLPKPDGSTERFRLVESPMISAEVAKERPDWKTYEGRGIDDPTATMRMSWSNDGFSAYVIGKDGAYLVDPYAKGDRENCLVYSKRDALSARGDFHCGLDRHLAEQGSRGDKSVQPTAPSAPEFSTGTSLRTYRLAVATTGEYTIARGGQSGALSSVMEGVNRINLVYRRDLAVSLMLVSGTNLIFPDPLTDPYNNTDQGAQLDINHATIVDRLGGLATFDVGHLFGTGGGGIATSPSVCNTDVKGEGYSARNTTTGDPFFIDYVAHELGHQLSAPHTYNNVDPSGTCTTRSADNAYEVASGSTIMSYVGICGQRNLQQYADDMFHVLSLGQIIGYVNTGLGNTCGTVTAANNAPPVVSAGSNFTIPKQTPFTLTASASDPNAGDTLTYSWEEFDKAAAPSGVAGTPAGTYDVDSDGVLRPLFRAYLPISSPSRTYPSLPYILNNANVPPLTFTGTAPTGAVCENEVTCVTGENLPTVTRTMNFRVTVRDNKTGIADAGMQLNVNGASGPFVVTAPNTATTVTGGTQTAITWNVANTAAAPVSASNVKISLSTDGGMTFPTVLTASTPNDGSEMLTIPNTATSTARIKVEAVGNIFFDISDVNFSIAANTAPVPVSLVSRKVHGSSGTHDINFPLPSTTVTECRSGGAGRNYQLLVTFANAVTVGGVTVTSVDGMATATQVANGTVVTIDLASVRDVQTATVTLTNVNNGSGIGDVSLPFRVLVGDTTADGSVTTSDIGQVKSQAGQAVTSANFRTDVTANGGIITSSDIGLVKTASGGQLP